MCTNMQYNSRRVYHKGTAREFFSKWKFSGSISKLSPSSRGGKDVSLPNVQVISDLIKSGVVCPITCGSCLECRVRERRGMAVRLRDESRFWDECSFVTLTYNKENLPSNGSVNSVDPADFVLELRKYICRSFKKCSNNKSKSCTGQCPKIKTFGCREYGPKLSRPHYHLCIFGFQFPDLSNPKLRSNEFSKKKWFVYRSKICASLWGRGFVQIGNLEPAAAEYVCGYTVKKIRGHAKDGHYGDKLPEGVVCRSKGIGFRFVSKYKDFLLRNGMVSFRKSKVPLPRYYRKLLEKLDPDAYKIAVREWTKDKDVSSLYKTVSPLRAKARREIKKVQVAQESRSYEVVEY